NAYCQDNGISWVDWSLLRKNRDLCEFTRKAIGFRKAHPALWRTSFFDGRENVGGFPDIRWYGPGGAPQPDWEKGGALACRIDGQWEHTGAAEDDDHLFLIFNPGEEPQVFELPSNATGSPWELAFSTQEKEPVIQIKGKASVMVDGHSVTAFTSR
ncbi:MAG TPA: hypothetical protein DCM68_01040, partial [Verrucomicrobia bacterium]|nr:hypothetical protein [Verrucomicrobiota bacterium]